MRKTFMFIYMNMEIGGIETYLIRLIRKLKEKGNRVIWLTSSDRRVDDGFKPDLEDGYVEIIDVKTKGFSWIGNPKINFEEHEEIIALAFDPIDFVRLETIKKKHENIRIDSFYWVPHFTRKEYFIEDFMIWPVRPIIKNIVAEIIKDMESNDNIFYLNESHAKAYMNRYDYEVINLNNKLCKGTTKDILPFDEGLVLRRSVRDTFNIISVGRFDFPHKAYILGLIKEYGELKSKYINLKLTIIGYGKDEEKVIDEIKKLSIEAQRDVNLVGKVEYDKLYQYFEDASLNISVAGAISDGALTGLISIPVRHYCEECEGYGYLPESRNKTTSSYPGIPIKKFIEEVINMDIKTYIDYSRKAYLTYADNREESSILSILELRNKDCKKTVSNKKINFIKSYTLLIKVLLKIKCETSKIVRAIVCELK